MNHLVIQSQDKVSRVLREDNRVPLPLEADKFVWCQAPKRLEAFGVVLGQQKGLHVLLEFGGGLVVAALHGRLLVRPVHAFPLAVGPGTGRFREAAPGPVFVAHPVENMA